MATIIVTISATKEEPLTECAKHIGPQCGKEILGKVLLPFEEPIVSTNCCYKLIQTGYQCHTRLTQYFLKSSQQLKNVNQTEIMSKNDKIFNKCDLLTKPPSLEILSKCAEQLGYCGEQVYQKLIHDKNITRHCCKELVKMGKPCHDDMVKALIRAPDLRNVDPIQLLEKSKETFDNCLNAKCTRKL
ncbi:hypothetical protein GLYMA_06G245400v4 [Glycine max]|uniref:Prolamin-like domain-containing protein n=3 Tax=Glycine subgen. Soja TaxID=1462606 RepID=A0A0R0JR96_SOYBN|nr:hypothetical protein GYH30_016159 [Glycine max]KAH1247416.1 hypothetical protein GmHk_06G017321 [Glycine max]KRH55314.1 hypothetical protein GLYMA_06G245400v4 [Glycine max]RZC09018.1 hypothetical protein D0Y65_015649 [Glycine soja]